MLQDNFLFDGTVAENIRYGTPHATMDDIERVSRIAHADEFIEQFEKGYETVVGERGVRLSGGQRQRVAIARAILADPRILLLDEATSSLDSESEAMIQDGLRSLRQGRTTFVIAHRLSTIRSADQILVLEGGEIVERGTHDELLARGRPLPAALRQAVQLRARPVHQSGRGLHAGAAARKRSPTSSCRLSSQWRHSSTRMKGLGKIYPPDSVVFQDIWLSFLYGAKIGVLGANGAGKSTLLKIMAGLDPDFAGEARLSPGYTVGYLAAGAELDPSRRTCSATSRKASRRSARC